MTKPKNIKNKQGNTITTTTTSDEEFKSKIQILREAWKIFPAMEHGLYNKNRKVLSTGILALDMLCNNIDPEEGNGGLMQGDIVELFGYNNTYKSGTIEHMIRATQRKYGPESVVLLLTEKTPLQRMVRFGINVNAMTVLQAYHPDADTAMREGEKCLNILLEFSKERDVKLIAVDSAAALTVQDMLYETVNGVLRPRSMEKADAAAARAKVWNRFVQKFTNTNVGSVLVLINQKHDQITTGFTSGAKESSMRPITPCGTGMDFGANVRIRVHATTDPKSKFTHPLTDKESFTAIKVAWTLSKLKDGRPTTIDTLESIVNLGYYTDSEGETRQVYIDRAAECLAYSYYIKDLIPNYPFEKKGNGYTYLPTGDKFSSVKNAAKFLGTEPKLQEELERYLVKYAPQFFSPKTVTEVETDGDSSKEPEQQTEQDEVERLT